MLGCQDPGGGIRLHGAAESGDAARRISLTRNLPATQGAARSKFTSKTVHGWRVASLSLVLALVSSCVRGDTAPEAEDRSSPDRSSISFVDNLLVKEEAGEWSRGEGLVATLELFLGDRDPTDVLRHPDLLNREGFGIIEMAHEYLDNGPDAEARREIARLLDILIFTSEELEAMAGIGQPAAGVGSPIGVSVAQRSMAQGAELDCQRFFYGSDIKGVSPCLEHLDFPLEPGSGPYRVYYPAAGLPNPGWERRHYDSALEAMAESAEKLSQLGKFPPAVNLVFSVAEGPIVKSTGTPAAAETVAVVSHDCGVALYKGMVDDAVGDFKQTIAHELAHCFQQETLTEQNSVPYEARMWREEGLAEYLSNWVFKENNSEWDMLGPLKNNGELNHCLLGRSYENGLFFQYLENVGGTSLVLDLVKSLPTVATSGAEEQANRLAQFDNIDNIYHDFAVAMTDGSILDTDGPAIPIEWYGQKDPPRPNYRLLKITEEGTPLLQQPLQAFCVSRVWATTRLLQEIHWAELEYLTTGSVLQTARPIIASPSGPGRPGVEATMTEWSDFPLELPDELCRPDYFLLATTTSGSDPGTGYELNVPDYQHNFGLEGDWLLENSSLEAWVEDTIKDPLAEQASATVGGISGELRVTFADGQVGVDFNDFTVRGKLESEAYGLGLIRDFQRDLTVATQASGESSYDVSDNFILYEPDYFLEGTESVHQVESGSLRMAGDELAPHEVDETFLRDPPLGWGLFQIGQRFDVMCGGHVLFFLGVGDEVIARFHRIGPGTP